MLALSALNLKKNGTNCLLNTISDTLNLKQNVPKYCVVIPG